MNPFKIKQLEEFTESDCLVYLDRYPYGEHYVEVTKRLKDIRSGKIKIEKSQPKKTTSLSQEKKKIDLYSDVNDSRILENEENDDIEDVSDNYNVNDVSHSSSITKNDNDSVLDKICSIIGVIIAGAIIIVIVLAIVDAFMSDDLSSFLQKHKGPIYAALRSLFNVLKHIR